MEEKHRSVKNLQADTSKANPDSQKAVPVNAWLLAQGSYKRPKPLLINLRHLQKQIPCVSHAITIMKQD